ncbi:MAG: hypothetical protein MRY32_09480 [Rickettsiales bacterium]|nr:hypothetical protein [Rickettsiales bacterium]
MDKEKKQNSFIAAFALLSVIGLGAYAYIMNVSRWEALDIAEMKASEAYPNVEEPYFRRQYVREKAEDHYVICGEVAESARGPFRRYHYITDEKLFLLEPVGAIINGTPTLQLKSFRDSWATNCEGKAG